MPIVPRREFLVEASSGLTPEACTPPESASVAGSSRDEGEGIKKSLSAMFDMMAPLGKSRKKRSSSGESGGRRRGGRGGGAGGNSNNGRPKDPEEVRSCILFVSSWVCRKPGKSKSKLLTRSSAGRGPTCLKLFSIRIRNLAGKARNAAQELAEYEGNEATAVVDVVVVPILG